PNALAFWQTVSNGRSAHCPVKSVTGRAMSIAPFRTEDSSNVRDGIKPAAPNHVNDAQPQRRRQVGSLPVRSPHDLSPPATPTCAERLSQPGYAVDPSLSAPFN